MSDLGVTFTDQLINELKKRKIETGNLRNEVIKFLKVNLMKIIMNLFLLVLKSTNYINVWRKWFWKNYYIS